MKTGPLPRKSVYDAENRLLSAYPQSPTNGSLAVVNNYDHRHRRIRKFVRRFDGSAWDTVATHTFVWDGNNIALEKIAFADGTTKTCEYYWGPDKSGTEQGAGGVGGLLAVSVDGVFYVPCYDHNGNVVVYVSESGATAAQYVYDPYGKVVEQSGDIAESLSFGFSTKYRDRETGMVSYQRRFYLPDLGRWLNRDPIEESGGENLYAFAHNDAILCFDTDGRFVVPAFVSPEPETPQPYQTPSVFDHLGSGDAPFSEEKWFMENYAGWLEHSKNLFIDEINAGIDCKGNFNGKSSRQSVDPGTAGNLPWKMPVGGNDRMYGDKGQNNWQTTSVLGRFAIDYVTSVVIHYGLCDKGNRKFWWSTTMYVEDTLGLQGDEGWLGRCFGWAAKSRRVRRAEWTISGSGTCNCCK